MRQLAVTAILAWAGVALAERPCTLRGESRDLPAGALFSGPVLIGRTVPFRFQHGLAVTLSAPRWSVRIDNGNTALSLELDPAGPLIVQATRPVRFGVFTVNEGAALQVHGAAGAQLAIGVDDPPRLRSIAPLRVSAPCKVASITPREGGRSLEDPAGAIVQIAVGEIPLSASPGGAPVGTLVVGTDRHGVLLDVRGESAHLYWSEFDGVIEGWVPARAVSIIPGGFAVGAGWLPGKMSSVIEIVDSDAHVCPSDAPLFAVKDGARSTLGIVKRGTPLKHVRADATNVFISLELDGVALEAGVELALDPKVWASCRAAVSP